MEETHNCAGLSKPFVPNVRTERRDAAEHRRRILEAAQHLFAEQGIEAVSMREIARAARIGQGTLYRRYTHKGELCMDLLREYQECFAEEIAELFAATVTSPVLERLDGVLAKTVALLEEQAAMFGPIAATEMREGQGDETRNSRCFSFHRSLWYRWLHELLTELLTEAVERRELVSLDVPYTADAIMATLYPPLYRFQRQERGFSPERILQGVRRIYIDGVKPPN